MFKKIIHNKYFYKYLKSSRIDSLNELFKNKTVRRGPFAGMLYPKIEASCSAIYPKLIGSYESELHPIIIEITSLNFNKIYDIGCAEGYYAIGFALKFPNLKIYAFDSDQNAINNCIKMAQYNNVTNVNFNGMFDDNYIKRNNFKNSLIICDCEGYESEIFKIENFKYFKDAFILVETHDFYRNGITENLLRLFNKSHEIKIVQSTSDIYKVFNYKFHNPSKLDVLTRWYLYAERRPEIMNWLYLKPLNY